MVRLTRSQQQVRTRASVLSAARREFIEHGYALAKVDRIAERAELTRGAVYSNFPSKRALYLSVLAELVEAVDPVGPATGPDSAREALGAFARTWLERLPLVEDTAAGGRLQLRSLLGAIDDERGRSVLAQVVRLEALLLAIGLESCEPGGAAPRRVRVAELALTLLGGSGFLAELAPGFGDLFDQASACEQLADLALDDVWAPAYLPFIEPAASCRDAWTPPAGLPDQLTGDPVDLGADGVVVVLGAQRLSAAEEAVRSGEPVTIVMVTSDPAETGNLVRLRVSDVVRCLRRVFPAGTWQHLRLIADDNGVVASAIGLPDVDDQTETAVRVQGGMIVARAQGRGAGHAVSTPDSRATT